ncbi:MAG: molybdopterin synthase sulfur carrier subunit [Chloroflexi bacterium]|nr:molybdopterin synthase sulfur carrier subunit [Chloroflexota bacterium]|tara:strand:- start:1206 stop:1484 length:279 start_codon:yes stop_codon:yes gene_type:complete
MSVTVRIPTPLRKITNGLDKISASGSSLSEIIKEIEKNFPGFQSRIYDENNQLRSFVNIYINGEDIRFLDGLESNTKSGDEVSIVPAVAGGN